MRLKQINWNKLSQDNWQQLDEIITKNLKKIRQIPVEKTIILNIDENDDEIDGSYEISYKDFIKYKTIHTKHAKKNFFRYVAKTYQKIIEI